MLLSDASADDCGGDEGYYCRLTYLLHSMKNNQRTQPDPLVKDYFSRQRSIQLLLVSTYSIAGGVRRPHFLLMLPAEAPFVGRNNVEEAELLQQQ